MSIPDYSPADTYAAMTGEWTLKSSTTVVPVSWTAAVPALASFATVGEIVATIGHMGDPDRSCQLLADLLLLADTDELAGRAVLQAIIPGLRNTARRRWRVAGGSGPWASIGEVDHDAVSAGWEAIHACAGQSHGRPAAVVVRRVERRLRTIHEDHQRRMARQPLVGDSLEALSVSSSRSASADDPTAEAVMVAAAISDTRRMAEARSASSPTQLGCLNPGSVDVRLSGTTEGPRARPLLLTVREAADMLGISRTSLYEMIKTGEIASVKRGTSRRIPLRTVYEYVDGLIGESRGADAAVPPAL